MIAELELEALADAGSEERDAPDQGASRDADGRHLRFGQGHQLAPKLHRASVPAHPPQTVRSRAPAASGTLRNHEFFMERPERFGRLGASSSR